MSWSTSFQKPVKKVDFDAAVDALTLGGVTDDGPMADQLRTAKAAAKKLATNIPGPYLSVSLNGHANGVGWQKKPGMSNDAISISVNQITEEDLQYYK